MEAALRKAVWDRAQATCEYCHMPQEFDRLGFEIDHIIPEKHGGPTVSDNLALSCFFCNRYKGPNLSGLDPVSGLVTPLLDPRKQIWAEHFYWNGVELLGRTPQARVTIIVLRINDPSRVMLRTILSASGNFVG
jgi:hypothetical protein